MLKTIIRDITDLVDPKEYPFLFNSLPDWVRETTLSYKPDISRKLHFYSWFFLNLLFKNFGLTLDSVYFEGNGKPISDDIFFNISHSGTVIFIVLSDKKIGCDLEEIKTFPESVKKRVFSPTEIKLNKGFNNPNLTCYCLWSVKEAYLKFLGTGIRNDMKSIKVDLLNKTVTDRERKSNVLLKVWTENGYSFAICQEK